MSSTPKEFHCKFCNTLLLPDAIKSDQLLVVCPTCHAVHAPIDFYDKESGVERQRQIDVPMPLGITIERGENELVITRLWRPDILRFSVSSVVWLFMAVFLIVLSVISIFNLAAFLFSCSFLFLFLAFFTITLINKTTIRITPTMVDVTHSPIPIPYSPYQHLPVSDIVQTYVNQRVERSKNNVSYSYTLQVIRKQKPRNIRLLLNIEDPFQALFIEQQLERFLHIPDEPVRGEFGNILSVDAEKAWVQAWRSLAAANNLVFTAGKLDAYGVSGQYRGCWLILDVPTQNERNSGAVEAYWTRLTVSVAEGNLNPLLPHLDMVTSKTLTAQDVPAVLNPGGRGVYLKGKITIDDSRQPVICSYTQTGIETAEPQLQFLFDSLSNLAHALPQIIALGGEIVPQLEAIAKENRYYSQEVALYILQGIARDTLRWREQAPTMLCPTCFTYWSEHKIDIWSLKTREYYGCRMCGQSREFIDANNPVIAVLDHQMKGKVSTWGQVVRVNWFEHGTLFDFDEVEIVTATDEEVERFAVKVGNDTDSFRQPHYKEMHCRVAENCNLSKNSIRVLQQMFGEVSYVTFESVPALSGSI